MFNVPTVTVAKTTLDGTSSSVTLDYAAPLGVSWTPRHLVVRVGTKSVGAEQDVFIQFNGDTANNYNYQRVIGYGTTVAGERITNYGSQKFATSPVSTVAEEFSSGEMLIPDALSTRSHKSTVSLTGNIEDRVSAYTGRWADTAAITSVTLTQNSLAFAIGSTFELCVVDESFNIDEEILGSNGTITVSSISGADGDIVQIGNLRSTRDLNRDLFQIDLNGDTTNTNYAHTEINASDTSVNTSGPTATRYVGWLPGNQGDEGAFGAYVGQFINYSYGSNDRTMLAFSGGVSEVAEASGCQLRLYSTRWNNTAAITSIKLSPEYGSSPTFLAGSMLSTYAVPKNLIERKELGTAANITFSSIPQSYDHLELSVYARCDVDGDVKQYAVWFNGDTTASNYERQTFYANSSTIAAFQHSSYGPGVIPGSTSTANVFGGSTISLQNYTLTDRHQSQMILSGYDTRPEIQISSSRWKNTTAITSIYLECEANADASVNKFEAGTVVELRGISSTIPLPAAGYTIFF